MARLESLDALRGFDMLLILGLDILVFTLAKHFPDVSFLQTLAVQMEHADWAGLHIYDLIFPIFVFISGVALSFSLERYRTAAPAHGIFKLWRRALLLAVLGMLVNGSLTWNESMRYASVLGLIGFSCAIAGTGILLIRKTKGIALFAGILLTFVVLAQFLGGDFTPFGSVNSYIDRSLLPGELHGGCFDPEGPLCIVSAAVLCLGGWGAGQVLGSGNIAPFKKALLLFLVGSLLFLAALVMNPVYPIIKSMWTGSFILAAAGIGAMCLALFRCVVDEWHGAKWFFPLKVVGVNALAAYLIRELIDIPALNVRMFSGLFDLVCPSWMLVALSVSFLLLQWLILLFLYKKGIFVKV